MNSTYEPFLFLAEADDDLDVEMEEDESKTDTEESSGDEVSEEETGKEEIAEEEPSDNLDSEEPSEPSETEGDGEVVEADPDPEKLDASGFNVEEIRLAELYDKFIKSKNILEQLAETIQELSYQHSNPVYNKIEFNIQALLKTNKTILQNEFVVENYETYLSSYYFIQGNLKIINDIFTVLVQSENSNSEKEK